jgi:hypothetical protein
MGGYLMVWGPPNVASADAIERHRTEVAIDQDLLDWIKDRTGPGGPFSGENDAIETALLRLRFEHAHVQAQCKKEKIRFDQAKFWRIYHDDIEESRPARMGRPRKDESTPRSTVARAPAFAGLEVSLVEWMQHHMQPDGPFETTGQFAETALRHLGGLEPDVRAPGAGFPFDAKALWAQYRKVAT